MQTILITGANGFVGYYLTRLLLQKNYRVIATGKGPSRLPFTAPNFIYETLDFANEESVKMVLHQHKPDVIVHAGALSKPDDCEQNKRNAFLTNVTGTIYLLQEAAALKSFFLFLSTDFVFEGNSLHYREDDRPNPVNYYGETKVLAEEEVKKYPFDWSIVRTVLVYGHPQSGRQNLLTMVANALKKGEELRIFSDQTRTPTYVEDLAAALVTIIEMQAKGIFHISGSDVTTPYDMACAVADYLQLDANKIHKVTLETFQQPALRPPVTGFDLSKAKRELGYAPTPFAVGLRKTFED